MNHEFYFSVECAECKKAIARIVSDFGNGRLEDGRYVFDQITHVPSGFVEQKLAANKIVAILSPYREVLVIFDPNPGNKAFRLEVTHRLGFEGDVYGLILAPEKLSQIFTAKECDFYIVALDGQLLCVASHEDDFCGNERVMWCPVPAGNLSV